MKPQNTCHRDLLIAHYTSSIDKVIGNFFFSMLKAQFSGLKDFSYLIYFNQMVLLCNNMSTLPILGPLNSNSVSR